MPVPKKVLIGPHEVEIKLVDVIVDEQRHHIDAYGTFDSDSMCIHLKRVVHKSMMADTLLHEIFHAVHYLCLGMSTGEGAMVPFDEETLTTLTSTHLCGVIKNNPAVFKWIQENLK